MLTRDGIAALVCLAVSIWGLFLTRGLPPALMVPIGPAFYPRVVLSFMAALSAILIVTDVLAARGRRQAAAPGPKPAAAAEGRPNYGLVGATFVVFGLYIAFLPYLGFRICTLLFVVGLQITLEWPRSWKRWLLVIAVAIGATIACYLAFETYLSVLLPRGSWTGL